MVQLKHTLVTLTDKQVMFLNLFFLGTHNPILIKWPRDNSFAFASRIRP